VVCLLLISANRVSSDALLAIKLTPLSADDVVELAKKKNSTMVSKSPPISNREFSSDVAEPDATLPL
jgi:hypothetical protein